MITKSHSIAIAEEPPSEKWSPAKILIARENGSIPPASRRKIYLRNGIAQIVKNRGRRQGIQHQEGTSSIRTAQLPDLSKEMYQYHYYHK